MKKVLAAISIISCLIAICLFAYVIITNLEYDNSMHQFETISNVNAKISDKDQKTLQQLEKDGVPFYRALSEINRIYLHRTIDWTRLQSQNSDLWGWVSIPNTAIDYPIMLEKDPNNAFYLWRGFDKKKNSIGSIMTYDSTIPEIPNAHQVLYGHHMDGSKLMFSELLKYSSKEYAIDHPYVYVYRKGSTKRYNVWLAKHTTAANKVYSLPYKLKSKEYAELIMALGQDVSYQLMKMPSADQHLLVLSTCMSGNSSKEERYIVVAVESSITD